MNPPVLFELAGQKCWLSAERCLYWEQQSILILSDLHFGKTGHFRKSGIAVPQEVYKEDLHRLFEQIQYFQPKEIIITGDLFHSRANQEFEWFAKWRADLPHLKIHLVKGNHDALHNKVYHDLNLEVHENEYLLSPFRFIHNPLELSDRADEYYNITGHIHPGVRVSGSGKQSLSFPCFYFSDSVAILPAFSKFTGFILVETIRTDRVFAIVKGNPARRERCSIVQIQ
jgi:uncharacterized protein